MASEAPRIEVEVLAVVDHAVLLVGGDDAPRDLPRVRLATGEAIDDAAARALRSAGITSRETPRLLSMRSEIDGGEHVMTLLVLVRDDAAVVSGGAGRFASDALPPLTPRAAKSVATLSTGFVAIDVDDDVLPLAPPPRRAASTEPPPVQDGAHPVSAPTVAAATESPRGRFPEVLGAGALLAGAFLWDLGVFTLIDREKLWSADPRSFFVAVGLTTLAAVVCSLTFGFRAPATSMRKRLARAAATLLISLCFVLAIVFFLEEMAKIRGNAQREAFVYLGVLLVALLRWRAGRPRVGEALPRFAITCVWLTAAFVTLWTISPKLRRAITPHVVVQEEE